MSTGAHQTLGQQGEELAAEFLVQKGFVILRRNVVFKLGEIDILAQDGDAVVVVEVKTVKRAEIFDPLAKISYQKRKKLQLLAGIVAEQYPEHPIRIDAVTLYWNHLKQPVITHFPNII